MSDDPEGDRLRAAFGALLRRKTAALPRHCCSSCGVRWTIDNSWFCLKCGTAWGPCCANRLEETEFQPVIGTKLIYRQVKYRCGCGGVVG